MKKISYNPFYLQYYETGLMEQREIPEEQALGVKGQVDAGKDAHWKDSGVDILVPAHSVAGYVAVRHTEDADAPHDDICDGYCANKGLGIVLKEVTASCYTLDGDSLASMSFVVDGETITVPDLDGDVSGLIKSVTYDCEAVNAEIAYYVAYSDIKGTATLTITATYNGETVTKAISAETECA